MHVNDWVVREVESGDSCWRALVSESPDRSIFLEDFFLGPIFQPTRKWLLTDAGTPVLGVLVPVDSAGFPLRDTAPFCAYQGFVRSGSWATKAGDNSLVLDGYAYLLEAVCNSLSTFVVETPPGFSDIRPLLWPSHGKAIGLQPSISVRY